MARNLYQKGEVETLTRQILNEVRDMTAGRHGLGISKIGTKHDVYPQMQFPIKALETANKFSFKGKVTAYFAFTPVVIGTERPQQQFPRPFLCTHSSKRRFGISPYRVSGLPARAAAASLLDRVS